MKNEGKEEKNFCEICGLKVKISEYTKQDSKKNEAFFKKLENLNLRKKKKFRKKIGRTFGPLRPNEELGFAQYCSLGSEKWVNKGNNCKDFQLIKPFLKLPDYFSIHITNKNARITNKLMWITIGIALLALLFAIL